jgi:hypothetical protein
LRAGPAQSLTAPRRAFIVRSCNLKSIEESHFLVARHVAAWVNVRMLTANRQAIMEVTVASAKTKTNAVM